MTRVIKLATTCVIGFILVAPISATRADEFLGPFPSWINVKVDHGAVGNGTADDTAAIQRALDEIRKSDSPRRVLYFPKGTYRITGTLNLLRATHSESQGVAIYGEDPEQTVIRWDGPTDGIMFHYNAWYSTIGRLTFDGAAKAKTAIQHGKAFTTFNEIADLIIKDVKFGIEAGVENGIAETAVLRCRFYRCSQAAISIQGFNSLDWYVWNCWFEDCGIGATNEFGAGNFHVYESTFLRSKDADITIRHTGYFSFYKNVSIGSRRFFHAKRATNWKETETWGSQCTLQDNLILDPSETCVRIENNGPNMLVDNVIRLKGEGPVVWNEPPADQADLISVGNQWTVENALQVKGRTTTLDDKTVKASDIQNVSPTPTPFLPRADRPVIEVKVGADATALQAAIDQAASLRGKRPVIHLPPGSYSIARTLTIPAGSDLQLVGDGSENCTRLSGAVNPLIRVQGPSHATFRNINVSPDIRSVAIEVVNCDQVGGRIVGEQLSLNAHEYGLLVRGLQNTDVELRDQGHNGIQVVGAGPKTQSRVALFAGSCSRHRHHLAGVHLYDVQNDARLFVRDIWYEGDSWSLVNLTTSGEFAYHAGFVAPYPGFEPARMADVAWEADLRKSVAPLQLDGFRGKVAFTLVSSNGAALRVKAPSPDLKLLLLGFFTNSPIELGSDDVQGKVVAQHLRHMRSDSTGTEAVKGTATDLDFVRDMLKPLRTVKPRALTPVGDDVTDVRFYRVSATGKNGVRLIAGANP